MRNRRALAALCASVLRNIMRERAPSFHGTVVGPPLASTIEYCIPGIELDLSQTSQTVYWRVGEALRVPFRDDVLVIAGP